jgi:Mg2+ and Co2+ transporter CorA
LLVVVEVQWLTGIALLIIDQCSRVFFDRTKPLDQRPEVIDIFGSAIGNVVRFTHPTLVANCVSPGFEADFSQTELTTIAYDSFWRNTALHSRSLTTLVDTLSQPSNQKYLDINPEGTLLREAQDIAEELKMMRRVFAQQSQVVKDYRRHLRLLSGEGRVEKDILRSVLASLSQSLQDIDGQAGDQADSPAPSPRRVTATQPSQFDEAVQAADILLELIENRQAELQDLEESALRTCRQLEGLLGLNQQQASIVEAKAALMRADESVKQGRAIMAFTLVTIFFLPLGFFAAFFGMNNSNSTGDAWMTLDQQVMYMFILSAVVITVSISIAFSPWVRTVLNFCLRVPLAYAAEYTGIRRLWKGSPLERGKVKRRNEISMAKVATLARRKQDGRSIGRGSGRKQETGGSGRRSPQDSNPGLEQARFRRKTERVGAMV